MLIKRCLIWERHSPCNINTDTHVQNALGATRATQPSVLYTDIQYHMRSFDSFLVFSGSFVEVQDRYVSENAMCLRFIYLFFAREVVVVLMIFILVFLV